MVKIENSVLVVIDVQGKLAGLMHDPGYLLHVKGMIRAAQILGIPIILTEQAPEKIGNTISEIRELLPENIPIKKQTFSCCGEPVFLETIKNSRRKQILVCGIEAHVCVYQTVRDLRTAGHDVYLVTDAVSSRSLQNTAIGIKRAEDDGATLTTLEMIITELIQSTKHPKFKEIMALLKNV